MGLSQHIEAIMQLGKTVRVNMQRKLKKPMQEYRALERAQKILEDQELKPNRAPMNVPKVKVTKDEIEHNKKMVLEIQAKSEKLIKNMDKLSVSSTIFKDNKPLNQHQDARSEAIKKKLPKSSTKHPQEDVIFNKDVEIPRGLARINDIIDILHNVSIPENNVSTEEIEKRFNLRKSDIENLIKHYNLIEDNDKLVKFDGGELHDKTDNVVDFKLLPSSKK